MAGVGKIQDETETSLAPESKEVLKKKKKRRGRGMSVAQKKEPTRKRSLSLFSSYPFCPHIEKL